MNKETYEKTAELIDGMVEFVKNRELAGNDIESLLGCFRYALDCRSIFFNNGRMTGKSEYIKRKSKPGDLIIVSNERRKLDFLDYFASAESADIVDIDGLVKAEDYNKKYRCIYFDDSSFIPDGKIYAAYNKLVVAGTNQIFIHLG